MEENLLNLCLQMKKINKKSQERLQTVLIGETAPSFFEEVKPAFEEASDLANAWSLEAEKWINAEKPKNLHKIQLDSTVENFEQIVLQSFYKDTKQKRHKNMRESVDYILDLIIKDQQFS
ncbi:DUF1798 family protein [Metabacillus sp. RGM 3146]|uniref:DUF1798 family protein n=1 Tax=Metabacillus sp. RGM 3146 TaxID=3401092 RepID=UPI003B99AC7A